MAFTILERIENGNVVLLRTPASPMILYRLKVDGVKGYPVRDKTTGTTDITAARGKALDHYKELVWHHQKGRPIDAKSFDRAAQSYIKDLEHKVKIGQAYEYKLKDAKSRYEKWFKPYFGKKLLPDIHAGDIQKFHHWRMEQYEKAAAAQPSTMVSLRKDGQPKRHNAIRLRAPTVHSQSRDETLIYQIFKHAMLTRMITPNNMIVFQRTKTEETRRDTITLDEWVLITNKLAERAKAGHNHPRIYFERMQFMLYVWWLSLTGMRTNEAMYVKWQDISYFKDNGEDHIEVRIRKIPGISTRKHRPRPVIAQPRLMGVIDDLKEVSPNAKPGDYVFRKWKGGLHGGYTAKFAALLKLLGIEAGPDGRKSLYSLRHYYATDRLENGIDAYWLAENMGTSLEMIKKNYGHLLVRRHASRMTSSYEDEDDEG